MRNKWLPALLLLWALPASADDGRRYQGYAEGEYIRVGLPGGGILEELAVQRGDDVAADTFLFRLDAIREKAAAAGAEAALAEAQSRLADLTKGKRPSEIAAIEAQLAQARAGYELAAIEFKRQEKLTETGAASIGSLDQARAAHDLSAARITELEAALATARLPARDDAIEAAKAAVERARTALTEARWRLDRREGRAPKEGRIFDTFYRAGEFIPEGRPVVSLLPAGYIKVRFFVPETIVGGLRPGQSVTVTCDGCASAIKAEIRFISPEAEFTPPVIFSEGVREKLVFLIEAWPVAGTAPLHPGQPVDVVLGR